MSKENPLKYFRDERPDLVAAFRKVVWQHRLTKESFSLDDLIKTFQNSRLEMGLGELKGGAASTELQTRMGGTKSQKSSEQIHYIRQGKRWIPTPKISSDWRFSLSNSHRDIRQTAREGLWKPQGKFWQFHPRGGHLPSLTCVIGSRENGLQGFSGEGKRGLYFLLKQNQNYVGQTDEFHVRIRGHKSHDQFFFAYPEREETSIESLNVAESLSIVGLSEIVNLSNDKFGKDKEPSFTSVRLGSSFALAFQAALARWSFESKDNFMCWKTRIRGIQECYPNLYDI